MNKFELGPSYWMSFPNVLNENLDPSSYLKFDGFFHRRSVVLKSYSVQFDSTSRLDAYRNNKEKNIFEIDTLYSTDVFVKFYPNKGFKVKVVQGELKNGFSNWSDNDVVSGTYYLKDFTIYCSMNSNGFQIKEVILFSNTNTALIKFKNYTGGPIYNGTFDFIPD